mmetsp:Transcript_43109/g.125481  ORF Transcript_43109/g.125481 Transcript_43109/m.125481 type:complete len:394 (+) Transcript_43109:40-1221(+)
MVACGCASGPLQLLATLRGGARGGDSEARAAAYLAAVEPEAAQAHDRAVDQLPSESSAGSQSYEFSEVLGTGSYGKVLRAWNKNNLSECGVKIIDASCADERETKLHTGLDHPNIVRLFESFESEGQVFIAMELCGGGDLYYALKGHGRFQEDEARNAFTQIMSAVDFMHARYIAHRDLKLENFLLDKPGVQLANNVVKLIDFGFATRFSPGNPSMRTKCGSDGFVAPEVIYSKCYDERCDIFSCGVVLHCLICGRMPFKDVSTLMKEPIYFGGPAVKKTLTASARSLIENMCSKNPNKRSSSQAVLASPWVNAVSDRAGAGLLRKLWRPEASFASKGSERLATAIQNLSPTGLLNVIRKKSARCGSARRPKDYCGRKASAQMWSGRPRRLSA